MSAGAGAAAPPPPAPAPPAPPAPSPGLPGRVERAVGAVTATLNVLGTLLIVALMVLVNADVIGRGVFGAPVSGVPEMVSLSIVAIVFLQVAEAARKGRLVRSDALPLLLAARAPRLGAALEALWNLAALALIWIVLRASWPFFVKAWERGEFVGAVGDFTAPVWPVKGIILIGCAALIAQFALGLARALAALRRG